MRLFYTLIAIFCITISNAQETRLLKKVRGQVELSEVVTLDSFSAAQLYFNSKLFLADAFHNVRETSQLKDDKAKSVATKGSFPVSITNGYGEEIKAKVVFTLIIQSKENMYRYTLNDFYFAFTEHTGITSYASFNDRLGVAMNPKQWQEVEIQAEEFFTTFIEDLKLQMVQTELLCKEAASAQKKRKLFK
jgi:hypothetical protein